MGDGRRRGYGKDTNDYLPSWRSGRQPVCCACVHHVRALPAEEPGAVSVDSEGFVHIQQPGNPEIRRIASEVSVRASFTSLGTAVRARIGNKHFSVDCCGTPYSMQVT